VLFQKSVFKGDKESEFLLDFFKNNNIGTYVDVGANLPSNSVTKYFANKWKGLLIEPIPENVEKFIEVGRDNIWQGAVTSPSKAQDSFLNLTLAGDNGAHSSLDKESISPSSISGKKIKVPVDTLDNLLSRFDINKIELLSIDTEGTEVDVLKGIDLEYFDIDLILIEDWGRDFNIYKYLKSKNYKRVRRTGYNSWYIKTEDNSISVSLFGYFQMFRKFVLSMPGKNIRQLRHKRKFREKVG
jgi:FkbM family methyltransferase